MSLFRIAYFSGETVRFTRVELEQLLKQSRDHNARVGITGILLYKDGNFSQVIEGEEIPVRELFEKIRHDPRHRRVIPVIEEPIDQRDFADWTMSFRDLDEDPATIAPDLQWFLHSPWAHLDFSQHSETIRGFLRAFTSATA
ncbi:BLUF domain-containing protein [Luteolibacter sp. Populi]|uniref:BLUF domain-containing protein n=1 Tax=Luteolibacter sp. Populi TaxID=3230487 RepID=UPI003465BA37